MMTLRKVVMIDEVLRGFEENHTGDTLKPHFKYITYAPNLGYRNHIFKYKSIYVLVFDAGNDCFSYLCMVNLLDILISAICSKIDWWGSRLAAR